MKHLQYRTIAYISIILCCTTCTSFKSIFSDESTKNLLKLDNLITEELQNQNYDIIYSIPNNGYFVKAIINNNNIPMLLDTGASFTSLKLEYFDKYQLKHIDSLKDTTITTISVFGNSLVSFPAKADTLKIGSITLNPWPFLLKNTLATDAILGCDFLHFTKSIIICNPGILGISLNSKPANNLSNIIRNENSYKEVDLVMAHEQNYIKILQQYGDASKTLESGVLMVPITVNEISGFAIIDTGASYSMLDSHKIDINKNKITIYSRNYLQDAKGIKKTLHSITLDKFIIDKYNLSDNFKIAFHEMKNPDYIVNNKSVPILGLIGLDILYKNNAIIDFGNRKLYLQI